MQGHSGEGAAPGPPGGPGPTVSVKLGLSHEAVEPSQSWTGTVSQ